VSERSHGDDHKPAVNADDHIPAVKKAVKDSDVAVDILAELRRQQQEQQQLIHEQRAIVDELRRHENAAHHLHDNNKYQVCVFVCVCTLCMDVPVHPTDFSVFGSCCLSSVSAWCMNIKSAAVFFIIG